MLDYWIVNIRTKIEKSCTEIGQKIQWSNPFRQRAIWPRWIRKSHFFPWRSNHAPKQKSIFHPTISTISIIVRFPQFLKKWTGFSKLWEIPLHDISVISKILHRVILNKLIENVVPKSLSKDLNLTFYAIWHCQLTYSRISLENQKIHHFWSTKFSIVGKRPTNSQKCQNFEYYFCFPKIFSNMTFTKFIMSQNRDEVLNKNSLGLHFQLKT